MIRSSVMIAALFFAAIGVAAGAPASVRQVGDTAIITRSVDSVSRSGNGSSGTTHDVDTILERVIAVDKEGVTLEYDLAPDVSADDHSRQWQLPTRIFKPYDGSPRLLDSTALTARVDRWLENAKLTRAACGHWVFTWNAFQIVCDPQTVLAAVASFDPGPDGMTDGTSYRDPDAQAAVIVVRRSTGVQDTTFVAEMAIDPDAVRRARAMSDVVVAEIDHRALTLDHALKARAAEGISGTIKITFETDAAGRVRQSTKITETRIKSANGAVEVTTVTKILQRQSQRMRAGRATVAISQRQRSL